MVDFSRKSNPQVSIVIPCKTVDFTTQRCMHVCELLYPEQEIIVIPDDIMPGYPAIKRNWAMQQAKGDFIAFLDSDAFPVKGWLESALYWLRFYSAVCGPGVLPHDASQGERIVDLIYQMMPYSYRVTPQEPRVVPEYPTFNLIVRRDVATEFDNYLTGEDTLFCRRIKDGIYYHPSIMVYHNRRAGFKKFWGQVKNYGHHRGFLIHLAVSGWLSVCWIYLMNFIKGLVGRKPRKMDKGRKI